MSDSEIDSLLSSIKELKLDSSQQNIEFELDKKIDEFIKIVFPGSTGPFNTTGEKLQFLKEQKAVDRSNIEKDKLKGFLTGYHTELAGVISNAPLTTAPVSEKPDEFGSFDGTFHETQQNAGCGRHALNNLLGGTFFKSPITEDAFNKTDPYTLVELKTAIGILNTSDPLDLQKLCKCLNAIYPAKYCPSVDNGINCCQVAENYDQMVLRTALELIGFDVVPGGQGAVFGSDAKTFNSSVLDMNITGVLINPGGHWTSARKHKGEIYYMNSINTNPQESQSSNKIITTSELNVILTNTIVLVVGPYIANSGKKDFIRLKIESIAKDVTDDNITIAGESGVRSIRSLIYDDLPLIIDDITDVKLIDILYENEIYIKTPYTDLAKYIVLFRTHTDKTKMQADLVKLLTTP